MKLSIAVPSSYLAETRDMKIKTYKAGMLARAASVFKVSEIFIYEDSEVDESTLLRELLEYAETPQYLRKILIPKRETLKYVGVIPPLRTPHHPVGSSVESLSTGEIREGVVRKVGPDGRVWVDIGVGRLALLKNGKAEGRVTVRVCSKKPLEVEPVEKPEVWGYRVKEVKLRELVQKDLLITSRKCPYADPQGIKRYIQSRDEICVIFGSARKGVFDMAKQEKVELNGTCWNFVPEQGTESVRTEEAIFATLAIINFIKVVG
jgi:hypothetical protein